MDGLSLAEKLALRSEEERVELVGSMTDQELVEFAHSWEAWARPNQLEPLGDWFLWLIMAGRGWGKSRTGAETVRAWVETGQMGRLALVARTAGDVRDVMIEGESGLLAISPPWFRPEYEPSKRRLTWPNGAMATTYTAEEPEVFRGPQHDGAWCDEIGAWKYAEEAYDNLLFGLRLGKRPRIVATTTPRPTRHMRQLIAEVTTKITRGKTKENQRNLAPTFLRTVVGKFEGTRLGRQELDGELLEDVPGALFSRGQIDRLRVSRRDPRFKNTDFFRRIAFAIDPAVTANADSAETGIVGGGLGIDGHGYIFDDLSGIYTPDGWARRAVNGYHEREADIIVGEVNNGGDLVAHTIHTIDRNVLFKAVRASRGKRLRAEPIAALYEQGKVHHIGAFAELEDQMCTWDSTTGEASPDRLDALVWLLVELMLSGDEGFTAPENIATSDVAGRFGGF